MYNKITFFLILNVYFVVFLLAYAEYSDDFMAFAYVLYVYLFTFIVSIKKFINKFRKHIFRRK